MHTKRDIGFEVRKWYETMTLGGRTELFECHVGKNGWQSFD